MIVTTFAACVLGLASIVNAQTLRNITVDDTDSAISYKGSWSTTNGSDSYKGAFQSSTEAGASATFTFSGVAIYYFMPLFETAGVSTILSLDSGPPQVVNLSRVGNESTRSAVRWRSGDLTNGRHTLVSSVGSGARGAVDGFIYSVNDTESRSITISSDDPRITYGPRGVWSTTTNVPSCAISKSSVRVTSTPNATVTFDFTSDTVYLNTINSPRGGKVSLSVNGGPPEIYDTYANTTGCGTSQSQKVLTVNVRRDLLRPRGYSNLLTAKNVDGETQIDGITDGQNRPNAAYRTIFMDGKFCAGTIFFVSYLLFSGIL